MDGKRKAEKASKISVVSKKSKTSRDGNEGPSSHNVESDGDEGPSLHNIESVEFVEDASASTNKLPRLSIRTSPLVLIKSIAKMNEAQKNSVNSMGFGDLLKMKVTKIPGKLGYWVLKSFDEDACELVINDGQRRIHIDEHDVWLTLGLPKGRTRIWRKTKSQYPDIVEAWKSYFEDHDPEKISPTLVSKRMIAEIDGGTWFKRLFLMLMATCLIEGSSNSYVQPKLLINFEDLTTVKDLNWCNYVIKVLIEQKGNWAKNTNNHFLGPISFLVVDRNANPTPIDTRDEVNEAEKNANPTPNDADDNHLDAPRNEELRTKNRLDRGKTKVTTETVLKRSTREQKKPDTLLSPYVVRVIDITDKLNKVEKDVYLWTFHNKEANSMEELYSDGNFTLFRNDIVTLAPRLHVSTSVVDVWCSILNNQEGSRSADSPYRFFATTLPCLKTIVDAPTDLSNNELQANFNYTLNLVLQKVGGVDLSKVDLRNYFINFLSSNGLDAKASLLKNSQMKVLQMPWRDNKNKDDCGVYVMRHMETYMGESQNRWNSGLRKGWKKPLAHLRVKYTKVILLSDQNIHKDKIKSASELHFTDSNEKGEINVEELVMTTTYSF